MDIRITGGRVVDPLRGLDGAGAVAVRGSKIVEDDGCEAALTLHADGCIVVPGLVDFHTHVFEGSLFGVEPLLMVSTGVTSTVDAGSCGCAQFEYFREKTMRISRVRVKAYLNVSTTGQPGAGFFEDVDPQNYKRAEIAALLEKYPDEILGLKLRISKPIVRELGLAAMDGALELAKELKLPLCVHVTNPPETMDRVVAKFRPGDIFCHVFQGAGHTILNEKGRVYPELFAARERGVIFDASNGRRNFSFPVAKAALKQGFLPDIISSDATKFTFNRVSGMKNLPFLLSKYLNMGLSLTDVIRAATATPAHVMGMEGQIGTLRPGAFADVAIFKLIEQKTVFTDSDGVPMEGTALLVPQVTVLNGQIVYCANEFNVD